MPEPNETFFVNVTNITGATAATRQGLGTIQNDDNPTLTIDDVSRSETNGTAFFNFSVHLSTPDHGDISFDIATAPGTAVAGTDYVHKNLHVEVSAAVFSGFDTYLFQVTVNGNAVFEGDDTFFVNVSNVTGATVVDGQGLGTIRNDDAAPSFSIGDVSLIEGDSGTQLMSFTVTKSGATELTHAVNVATADSSATVANADYVANSSPMSFLPSDTSKTFNVPINGDTDGNSEGNEQFFVNLSAATNGATIGDNQALGIIRTDDPVSITALNTPLVENFDGLSQTTAATTPPGWTYVESGASANATYSAGTGSSPTGDTYSFGAAGTNPITDRALGSLRDASVESIFGAFVSQRHRRDDPEPDGRLHRRTMAPRHRRAPRHPPVAIQLRCDEPHHRHVARCRLRDVRHAGLGGCWRERRQRRRRAPPAGRPTRRLALDGARRDGLDPVHRLRCRRRRRRTRHRRLLDHRGLRGNVPDGRRTVRVRRARRDVDADLRGVGQQSGPRAGRRDVRHRHAGLHGDGRGQRLRAAHPRGREHPGGADGEAVPDHDQRRPHRGGGGAVLRQRHQRQQRPRGGRQGLRHDRRRRHADAHFRHPGQRRDLADGRRRPHDSRHRHRREVGWLLRPGRRRRRRRGPEYVRGHLRLHQRPAAGRGGVRGPGARERNGRRVRPERRSAAAAVDAARGAAARAIVDGKHAAGRDSAQRVVPGSRGHVRSTRKGRAHARHRGIHHRDRTEPPAPSTRPTPPGRATASSTASSPESPGRSARRASDSPTIHRSAAPSRRSRAGTSIPNVCGSRARRSTRSRS